jgi:uncharacterized membrane protein
MDSEELHMTGGLDQALGLIRAKVRAALGKIDQSWLQPLPPVEQRILRALLEQMAVESEDLRRISGVQDLREEGTPGQRI